MPEFEFSNKLKNYLKKVETETGKEVKILESPYLGIKGMWAGFRYHPDYIIIIIRSDIHKTSETMERSIAHEATHGYILFKNGYCMGKFPESTEDSDKKDIQLVFTMVDDIVVNKIIAENGFTPFGVEYMGVVQREIDSMIQGVDLYRQFSDDLLFDDLLMITRYIIAWGFLEYYHLERGEHDILKKFLDIFKETYPLQYEIACQIKQIIKSNDIFTSSGHCEAMKLILKLLKFDRSVKVTDVH